MCRFTGRVCKCGEVTSPLRFPAESRRKAYVKKGKWVQCVNSEVKWYDDDEANRRDAVIVVDALSAEKRRQNKFELVWGSQLGAHTLARPCSPLDYFQLLWPTDIHNMILAKCNGMEHSVFISRDELFKFYGALLLFCIAPLSAWLCDTLCPSLCVTVALSWQHR